MAMVGSDIFAVRARRKLTTVNSGCRRIVRSGCYTGRLFSALSKAITMGPGEKLRSCAFIDRLRR